MDNGSDDFYRGQATSTAHFHDRTEPSTWSKVAVASTVALGIAVAVFHEAGPIPAPSATVASSTATVVSPTSLAIVTSPVTPTTVTSLGTVNGLTTVTSPTSLTTSSAVSR
jgi:hypothetical protein